MTLYIIIIARPDRLMLKIALHNAVMYTAISVDYIPTICLHSV